jgi:hypothetical protein
MSKGEVTIFDDATRSYCYLSRVQRYRRLPGGARFAALTNGGEAMTLDIRFVSPPAVRVRCRRSADGPMPIDATQRPAEVSVEARGGRVVIRSRAFELRVVRRPFHYGVFDFEGRKLVVQQIGDVTPTRLVSLPLGYSRDSRGRVAFHESFELSAEEHLHCPQQGALDLRGRRLILPRSDAADAGPTDLKSPSFWSSRGYGVFVDHAARTVFELGHPSPITVSFRVEDAYLDYVVVFGADGEEIMTRYAEIGGRIGM